MFTCQYIKKMISKAITDGMTILRKQEEREELGIFSSAIIQHESEDITTGLQKLTETISQENCLSPASLNLIEEIKEINRKFVV